MRKNTFIQFFVMLLMMLSAFTMGCRQQENLTPQAMEDEIKLMIQLDLKEDIGLLILDNNLDGIETSGGISNADRSTLKHNEVLDWTFSKQEYENTDGTADVSVRFRVITEYFDPNYENKYPEEYTVLLEPVSFKADFGETYHITITGDKDKGYQAFLKEH